VLVKVFSHKRTSNQMLPMFGPTVVRQVWHPDTLRSPEWDAKQFGNIKSLYLSAFDERTSPRFGQTRAAFFSCAFWLISVSGLSASVIFSRFAFWIGLSCREQGHFVSRIVGNFRNEYPAMCCSAFRIRGGVLCIRKYK
jgi:hypothetical protein